MGIKGFGNPDNSTEEKDTVTSDSVENYTHRITLFGIPVFKSTKYHHIDSKRVGKE